MRTSEKVGTIGKALATAQQGIETAKKDRTNPHFKSSYADLASVWSACKDSLNKNGIAVVQGPASVDGLTVTVTTLLVHESGEWLASDLTLKPVKADPQGVGSAITYGRRYGLAAMVGVAPEDDDGNAASGNGHAPPAQRSTPAKAPASGKGAGRLRFANAVKAWTGLNPEDIGSASAQIAVSKGHKGASGLTDEQYVALAEFVEEMASNGMEFVDWAAKPAGAKA